MLHFDLAFMGRVAVGWYSFCSKGRKEKFAMFCFLVQSCLTSGWHFFSQILGKFIIVAIDFRTVIIICHSSCLVHSFWEDCCYLFFMVYFWKSFDFCEVVFIKNAIVWVNMFLLICQNRLDGMCFISSKFQW